MVGVGVIAGSEMAGRAVVADAAAAHDDCPGDDLGQGIEFVRDDDQGRAALDEPAHDGDEHLLVTAVDSGGRLVHQEDLGPAGQSAGDQDAALLPAGERRDIVRGQKVEKGPGGRIAVDEFLRAKGYPDVFIIGDMGLALNQEGKPVPTTAQHAGQQGRTTAKNIMNIVQNRPLVPYEPTTLGEFVSLGGLMAVGWMKLPWNQKLAITGGIAHVMKRASEWKWRSSVD